MLKSFTIENFKSFKGATLELASFTLMVGANASGKSNAIEALRYSSWLVSYKGDTSGFFSKNNFRGTKLSIFNEDNKPIRLKFYSFNEEDKYGLKISLVTENNINSIESVEICGDFDPTTTNESFNDFSGYSELYKSFNSEPLRSDPALNKARNNLIHIFNKARIYECLKKIFFLDVIPSFIREYSIIGEQSLGYNAENTSSILHSLCKDKKTKGEIINLIKILPEQNIVDIDFITTERNEVMVKLIEKFGDKEFSCDASLLSDGTLRALAIVAFLLSAKEDAILIIEEIDNGIHPSRIKDFMKKIYHLAAERKVQVLMTSHNPALLDAIPDESLEDVVCCYRDKDEGDSRFVRLGDLHLYPELVAQGSLGDLVTGGILERYVHDKRTPAEILQQRLDWLKDFQAKQEALNDSPSIT